MNPALDHEAINHVVSPPNIASNSSSTIPSSTNGPSNFNPSIRSSFHSNYYANTQYQIYQPSNLQTNYHHPRQYDHNHMHLPNNALQHQVTHTVVDSSSSSSLDNYNNSHDHYTEDIIIQAILAAKEALEKPIEERDERDILLIDNLCSLVHGFDAFPKTVRRALAAQAVLIVIDEKGKELIVHNEELDSFCVLIFGECEQLNIAKTVPIRYYNVGDAFGVCEPTNETIRFVGHMVTRCENCAFLCVKRDDFYTILTDPANYPNKDVIRHKDRSGNIVCVSQFDIDKKSSGPLWSHHMQSTNPFKIVLPDGHIIIKVNIDQHSRNCHQVIDVMMTLILALSICLKILKQ